jgi:Rieske 2Fe-2S family protein
MQNNPDFQKETYGLHKVATAVWQGFIFLNLAPEPEPFNEAFAPLLHKFDAWQLETLSETQQIVYEVEANWKIIFHNYSECYHCPAIHPKLNELTPYRNSSNDFEEGFILGGPMKMSLPQGSMTMNGRVCAPILHQTNGLVYYYTIFPTMFFSLFPDYVMTHHLQPQSATHTRIICDWYFAPNATASPHFTPAVAISFWDMTNRQDWEVCQLTQLGVASQAFTPGHYADLESMLAAFDRAYLQAMAVM